MKKLSSSIIRGVLAGLSEGLSYKQITERMQTSKASVSRISQGSFVVLEDAERYFGN